MRVGEETPASYGLKLRDPDHVRKFHQLKGRGWKPTRYIDWELIGHLGLGAQLTAMASGIRFESFMHLREPTFKGLTLEFLSSLDVSILRGPGSEAGRIVFQLGGVR